MRLANLEKGLAMPKSRRSGYMEWLGREKPARPKYRANKALNMRKFDKDRIARELKGER